MAAAAASNDIEDIEGSFEQLFKPVGLEWHPFQVGWYNELVGPKFTLDFAPATLAFVVISGPDTFEKCVLPYLQSELDKNPNAETNDPLDDAMVDAFSRVKQELKSQGVETTMFQDFELYPNRRPKVLVQTAAHVSGAVQYFHKCSLSEEIQKQRFAEKSDLCGVAVHPKYGGWFAIRGVIIIHDFILRLDEIPRPQNLNLIPDQETAASLIEEFAYNWEADKWRTVYKGESGIEYSQDFKEFLAIPPGNRWKFIRERGFLQSRNP